MKTFTEVEKTIARNINKEYKWMARDWDGNLCIYEEKPRKEEDSWYFGGYDYISYFNHLFSAIQWEDEEPTRISDIYNPPVLSDEEREYLTAALKPFHEKVKYVEKIVESVSSDKGWRDKEHLFVAFYGRGMISMPDFDAGEMYSGMEPDRAYSLDELRITYKEEDE